MVQDEKSVAEDSMAGDYEKARASFEETLLTLKRSDVSPMMALVTMGEVLAAVAVTIFPYEIARDIANVVRLRVEKLHLESDDLPRC
jgi:phage terminase Nu1 subunit (DNA packaging protein)